MAMLAGPRRKQKVINLRAKNNAWSDDSTKFGQRMLEKMGWCEGKGLGAKENGIVQHVVARYKNDDAGLGFEDRNDQWTKHEDDFNSLLANLSNGDNNDEKLHSGVSLEVKSKKSKARVHYHKFTRGKDLTRYSEKDLANIFGKKTLKNDEKQEEKPVDTDVTPKDKVFTEKGSMEDYFKNKLAAIKSKNMLNIINNDTNYNNTADYSFRGFSGAKNDEKEEESCPESGFQSFSFCNTESNDNVENENSITECQNDSVESKKKSKKKKKHKYQDEEQPQDNKVDNSENSAINVDLVADEPPKTKKSKMKKQKKEFVEDTADCKISKKKKQVVESVEDHVTEDYLPKKKKKRKNKDIDE